MTKFWLIMRYADMTLVPRPPDTDRAEAVAAAGRLAAADIGSRFVVLEAVACTTEPVVQIGTEDI